jgi:hypothetical protein
MSLLCARWAVGGRAGCFRRFIKMAVWTGRAADRGILGTDLAINGIVGGIGDQDPYCLSVEPLLIASLVAGEPRAFDNGYLFTAMAAERASRGPRV